MFFCSKPLSPPKQNWWNTELKQNSGCVLLTEELRRQEITTPSTAEVLGDSWPIYKHARLVFNSETLISYFQLIIVISGSTVEAGRDVGQWGGGGCDGGQARWMTQFTAVTLLWRRPARLTVCAATAVLLSVIEFLQIFLFMRSFSCPDNKPGKSTLRNQC